MYLLYLTVQHTYLILLHFQLLGFALSVEPNWIKSYPYPIPMFPVSAQHNISIRAQLWSKRNPFDRNHRRRFIMWIKKWTWESAVWYDNEKSKLVLNGGSLYISVHLRPLLLWKVCIEQVTWSLSNSYTPLVTVMWSHWWSTQITHKSQLTVWHLGATV